jgi:hypothetical protein
MKLDISRFLSEIAAAEKALAQEGGSAWRSGITEGFGIIKRRFLDLSDNEFFDELYFMNTIKADLKIDETIEAWRGSSSSLGEEIEWFNGLCKTFDVIKEIIDSNKL